MSKCKHGDTNSGHYSCSLCMEEFYNSSMKKMNPLSQRRKDYKGACITIQQVINSSLSKKEMIEQINQILDKEL